VAADGSDRFSGWCCTVRYDSLVLNANHGSDRICLRSRQDRRKVRTTPEGPGNDLPATSTVNLG
jgi:hypothetical protein